MSAGKRFKFQGSTIAVITAYAGAGVITGISKANPAVVTQVAHGYADGDVVRITAVVGMTEVNDEAYIINVLTVDTYELIGLDSRGFVTYTSGGAAAKAAFSSFCELTGYNRQGGSKPETDATSVCSTAAEYELGLPNFGTSQFDYFFAPQTGIQLAVQGFELSGDKTGVKVTLPKSGGIRTLLGFVQQTSEQGAANGIWKGAMTLRNTGSPYDQAGV